MNQNKIWSKEEIKKVSQKVWHNVLLQTTRR